MIRYFKSKSLIFFVFTICLSFPPVLFSSPKMQHFELSRFISPEKCGECHDEIYNQWKYSMHNLSHVDPIYRAVAYQSLTGLTDAGEIMESEICVKCHTPVGFFSGFPNTVSQDRNNPGKVAAIPKQGVQCDFCHSATGAYAVYNNQMKLDPGHGEENPGIKRGPFKDSESDFHKNSYSEFHTNSEMCGVCHNVRHAAFGTKLDTTYEEWSKSRYNSPDPQKRLTCQGCHMFQRPGVPATGSTPRPKNPGQAAQDGPQRKHIYTHYFLGGNMTVPSLFGDKIKAKMVEEHLKKAADLDIDPSNIEQGKIIVSVKNTGAGHSLPTGITDVRQMWLEVVVKDAAAKTIFSSGVIQPDGYLPKGSILFNTVFGDGKGKEVDNISKARQILRDHRVPPLGSLREVLTIPGTFSKPVTINVRLLYRSLSQEAADRILGKGKVKIPLVVMAEANKTVK